MAGKCEFSRLFYSKCEYALDRTLTPLWRLTRLQLPCSRVLPELKTG